MSTSIANANNCPICDQPIPDRRRGARHGPPPKTCSEACRKIRASRRESERYQRVKDTDDWKATRANYRLKIKDRLLADPEFAVIFRAESAASTRAWLKKVQADPARHEQYKAEKRAHYKAWREKIESNESAWEAHKARCRAWYASLSIEEKRRILGVKKQDSGRVSGA